ncbi:unnamed protein product [Choristocarpus tenellus]
MQLPGKGWDGLETWWRGTFVRADCRVVVGVCAMDKKAMSKHMKAITSRLSKFEVIFFGNQCILNEPVEQWPKCDCLIAFYSTGFPIAKAKAYVELRKPYCLNSLDQDTLRDRRRVYDLLKEQRIPIPENVYANRDRYNGVDPKDLVIVEADDYIEVNGTTIHKPFVEKPVNAEDHNIHIYYPMSAGGGSKRLFRKVGDRSSEFYPEINEIRREGSYIYEAFVETQGTDVKVVYTVGPDYGHAEARKSPTLDGKVNRNTEGKEIRYPVILSQEEIDYARKITLAFQQCVCGFDILRVHGRSFVCDVNGWSFVKNNRKYIEDCAQLLQEFIQAALKPGQNMVKSPAVLPVPHGNETPYNRNLMDMQLGSRINSVPMTSSNGNQRFTNQGKHLEELRCVITIARHGDRTPKQKMKMKTSFQHYLDFYDKYSPGHRQDLKIKGKMELKQFLATTVDLIESLGPDEKDHDSLSKLHQIRHVLERWEISGINRKLQLKPLQRDDIPPSEQEPHNGGIGNGTTNAAKIKGRSLLLILKWGGELTKLGEEQAMELGGSFRRTLYPDAGRGGLLRLHREGDSHDGEEGKARAMVDYED